MKVSLGSTPPPLSFIAPCSLKLLFYFYTSERQTQARSAEANLAIVKLRLLKRNQSAESEKSLRKHVKKNSQNPPVLCPQPSATPSNTLIPLSSAFSLPKDHAGELRRTRRTQTHTLLPCFTHLCHLSLCVRAGLFGTFFDFKGRAAATSDAAALTS